eukprot:GHVL01010371.1.p1 GENE.GHVL01010371.1~~GHVL01010371.1.p1  ORF type:complete len:102 (+),score=0.19 GHVL01010371.1:914-1219(+)
MELIKRFARSHRSTFMQGSLHILSTLLPWSTLQGVKCLYCGQNTKPIRGDSVSFFCLIVYLLCVVPLVSSVSVVRNRVEFDVLLHAIVLTFTYQVSTPFID